VVDHVAGIIITSMMMMYCALLVGVYEVFRADIIRVLHARAAGSRWSGFRV